MSFNYDKNKNTHGSSDSFWASYSDLFLGLSTIFLLLYVVASLRTGTDAIRSQIDNQKLTMENEELRGQLKMYENVRADYMEKAAKDEVQEYKELMDKLTLLQEEAKSDQERLAMESLENERKAKALNKYQQMVRNIINANKVAKNKLITRNDFIQEQDLTIDQQKENIDNLEKDVEQKRDQIERGEMQIAATKEALNQSKKELLKAFKNNQITRQVFEEKTKQLQAASDRKVRNLLAANQQVEAQLNQINQQLEGTQNALAQTEAKARELETKTVQLSQEKQGLQSQTRALAQAKAAIEREKMGLEKDLDGLEKQKAGLEAETRNLASAKRSLEQETSALKGSLNQAKGEADSLKGQIAGLKSAFAAEQAKGRAALDAEIRKGQMDAAERGRREEELRRGLARKEKEMNDKIAGLQGSLRDTEGQLAKAREEMDARREIAREIRKGFAAAGIKADIDMQTGEVVLDFGDHYFESDSAALKNEMKDIIEKAMPVYSRSLFGNNKVASKISAVEIIGFASPTYQGRFVDPRSSKTEDKAALKYNMDLSYRRANSIFSYLLEGTKGEFEHQKNLMSLMKVSGRSFLEVMKVPVRGPATAAQFCKVNDCKKAQRVIVRFSMDGKK